MRPARLGDVVASMKNGIYKPASEYNDDGVPCLRMYNIEAGAIAWRDIKRMRISAQEQEDYGLREGDLLVNRVNSRELVGKSAYVPASIEPSVFESKNIRVRLVRDRVEPKFINYQLLAQGSRHFANNAQQVVGMASISQGQLADFPIVLTDLDGQRRIVAELEKQFSRLDEAVANLHRVTANLKRYTTAVIEDAVAGRALVAESDRAGRGADSAESAGELLARLVEMRRCQWRSKAKYKEPPFPYPASEAELPPGWTVATVEQVAFVDVGNAFKSNEFADSGVRLLRGENIEPGRLRWTDTRYWPHEKVEPFLALLIEEGDIILAMDRPIISSGLKLARARKADLPCLLVQRVARLRCVDRAIADYLHIAMSTEGFKRHLVGGQTGTQLPHVSGPSIGAFRFPLPPLIDQRRVVAEVDHHLSIVRSVEAEVDANLKRAQALRQSVLARAFSGEPLSVETAPRSHPTELANAA